jgi:hypothetical protein
MGQMRDVQFRRDLLRDSEVCESITKIKTELKDRIQVAENRVQECVLVNMIMNFRVNKSGRIRDHLSDFQLLKGSCTSWSCSRNDAYFY